MQVDAYASRGTAYTQLGQVHKAVAANPAGIDRQHLIGSDPSETLRVGIAAFASSSFKEGNSSWRLGGEPKYTRHTHRDATKMLTE